MAIIFIPVISIGAVIFLTIILLWIRQRRRNQQTPTIMYPNTAFVPQRLVIPMQPPNPQYPTPMHMPMPVPQPFPYPNPNPVHPIPVPQPIPTTPIIPNPSNPPDPSTPPNLMERMRQVQLLMMEIHRLESESAEQNFQHIQELKQRVIELSNTDGLDNNPVPAVNVNGPPPAYFPRNNDSGDRPELGDGRE